VWRRIALADAISYAIDLYSVDIPGDCSVSAIFKRGRGLAAILDRLSLR
jgi:hypothetical protein